MAGRLDTPILDFSQLRESRELRHQLRYIGPQFRDLS